ncbi:Armadillo-type fold protein [Cordyceps fumosorosea ARSEF 2679]|uniref:Armadillo-type fold protein n=1 Tax=Cordyceps fumosorosea (strain ARSEF 2679) TaxID=1081104 RepID=A0A167V174_CORFA|nr:Armadillo-type fold protein [Cordyceps fumosorosea ARSEF 2679]OAA62115.1 Armadillo-type fold protein [Cordyceps fumosorosea ARSEF 2679]
MSFSIEVPGEANPLNFETLCHALLGASSTDYAQRQSAGQQLESWGSQGQPGYYLGLQTAFLDRSLPVDARFLAVIQLKNGIDRLWRVYSAATKNGIKPDEKAAIRSRLFQGTVDEPDRKLALHNSLVIAKIVRIDYPNEWPDALASIISLLRSSKNGNQHQLHGALEILLRVVKELGTARLRKSQTALQSVTPEIVYVLSEIYAEKSNIWVSYLSSGQGTEAEAKIAMQNSLSALRTLRRLVVVGYDRPHSDSTVEQFWMLSQNQFGQLLNFVNDSNTPNEMVGKHLLQFTKLHIDMAEQHAASFAFLPNSLPLVRAYWDLIAKFAEVFDSSGGIRQSQNDAKAKAEGPLLERLALKGLLLLRACVRAAFQPLQTFKYRTPEVKEEQDRARNLIKSELLQDELVVRIVNTIISHLFLFRKSDLEAWDDDPEEWEQQEQSEGNAYEWEVRPCAEKLFLDLLTNYKQLLIPPLLQYFQSAQTPQADIATKEAVYTAMGLSAAHIVNSFDFEAVLSSTLISDAQQSGGLFKVLRRRIAILISQWAPIQLSDQSRPVVYQIFRHFLNPEDETNDIVVRITAARQLRWIADELEFNVDAFLPYTPDVLGQLVYLVHNVRVDETKLAILESIRILVMRMEDQVAQFGDQLMTGLPEVWENSDAEEYMIKQHIIAIFAALVTSMGNDSQRYHNFMMPLLSEAAREGSDLHVHLIDESLELWTAILEQSKPPLNKQVLDLADAALPLLSYQQETASVAMSAVESYILIAPAAMLDGDMRTATLTALSNCLTSTSRGQVRSATVCIEYLIRAAAQLGGSDGISVVIRDMVDIGFMRVIMGNLRDAWEAHQTTGPNRRVSKLNTVTQGDYFAILARLALAEPGLFVQLLASFGALDEVWSWLSAEWFSYIRSMDNLPRQKLFLLGLTRLLELPSPMQELTLAKLQDYFDMWAGVLAELQEGVPNGHDTLIGDLGELGEATEYDTPKRITERQMVASDPVHTIQASQFVRERLQDVVGRVGGESAFQEQWAANVDRDVTAKFQTMAGLGQ